MKTYKVWLHVEEHDPEKEGEQEYQEITLPEILGQFGTPEQAGDFVENVKNWVDGWFLEHGHEDEDEEEVDNAHENQA